MNNKIFWFVVFFIIVIAGVGFLYGKKIPNFKTDYNQNEDKTSNVQTFLNMPDREMTTIAIGEKKLEVEVVNSDISRMQGLSGRDEISSDGMLFVFPQKSYQSFWMKDMRFDLDFIWISEGRVVEIMKDVMAPEARQNLGDLPRFVPQVPVEMMLEVVAGDAEKWGVGVGDGVEL